MQPGLFSEVLVPVPARREVEANGETDAASSGLANADWATSVGDLPIPPMIAAWDLSAEVVHAALIESAEG